MEELEALLKALTATSQLRSRNSALVQLTQVLALCPRLTQVGDTAQVVIDRTQTDCTQSAA